MIVTGCLGAKAGEGGDNLVAADASDRCWPSPARMRPQEVMDAVHAHLPKPHDPFVDLVPAAGIKLTPRHYAYLKISEGCNHRCTFCIIPSHARRPGEPADRRRAAARRERLFEAGVKELLVISQDT